MKMSVATGDQIDTAESAVVRTSVGWPNIPLYLLLAVVWLISALYMGMYLNRGWHAGDDGTLAQSAERAMLGELPHRDFDESYTGGLNYLNAAAFRILGTNLASMRYPLYIIFLAWIPALFFVARQFGPGRMAAGITLLAVAWSVPNCSIPMASWYNLFFATFGLAAAFRYIEGRRKWWLFVAGICGGISFLAKLSGMYFVAGVILFLLLPRRESGGAKREWYSRAGFVVATLGALGFVACVFALLRRPFHAGTFLYFFVPVLATAISVVWFWLRLDTNNTDFRNLMFSLLAFAIGVSVPILLFLIPYIKSGSVADFVRGIFVLPGKRLLFTTRTQSLPRFLVGGVVDAGVIVLLFSSSRIVRAVLTAAIALASAAVIFFARSDAAVFDAVWVPIRNLLPVTVVAGIITLAVRSSEIESGVREKTFLLLATTATCSLVQFPYGAPIYFCYVAPLLLVSILALIGLQPRVPSLALAILFCAALVYAALDLTPRFQANRGEMLAPGPGILRVDLPRAGALRLYGDDARENAELVGLIHQHAQGDYIYATPDCPQVYFLSGFRNPTRTQFDFLDDPVGRTERILTSIHAHKVNLVVIYRSPSFSGPVPADLLEQLEVEFPQTVDTHNYQVRWRDAY